MRNFSAIALASTTLLLAACVGGGSGGASFDSMATRGQNLINAVDGEQATPVGSMPTTGTATYAGVAAFAPTEYDQVEILSEASLKANFGSSSISGNLSNFRDYENNRFPGSVAIQSGVISGNQFDADLSGSLTVDGAPTIVKGTLNGGFVGANANLAAGAIEGTVGGQSMVGVFGAEKK
jgi:hypothetical protein